ncbi:MULTISPECIES: hybrid sensor histidine kinase/response regulator [unclassified Brevundimonas]|uniref:hybrid sensor histidine kinase/response regulator n=1 Tax=unclassified Brevundimonas TaxID=2622653 RepID=UPI0025C64E62|nr:MULTISPECIES: ATP-binding protein [unclassified Brevundimonas]
MSVSAQQTERLLQYVEKRASSTTFGELDAFGRAASVQYTEDGLRRLQHVYNVYINNGETERAGYWNRHISTNAERIGSKRYQTIAQLNAALIAYEEGDTDQAAHMRRVMDHTSDWYVRLMAVRYYSITRFDTHQVGEGLKLLSMVQAQIPEGDAETEAAQAGVWEMIGIGLMSLHDVQGATDAFSRYEMEYSQVDWPRPDFDTVYNLGGMAISMGDAETGQRYFEVHDRLARRADLHGLVAHNALMCARLARVKDDMQGILACLADHETLLAGDVYLQQRAWPLLVIAMSRQSRLAQAEALYRRWDAIKPDLVGGGVWNLGVSAQAELAFARGEYGKAMRLMREYSRLNALNDARAYSDGINQVTQDMQQQLTQRRHQLTIEQANVRLQAAMIRAQTWIVGVTLFFLICGTVFAIWLWVQARELRKARQRAEEASTAKTRFLANMSHEIRTPLNGVIAMADALAQRSLGREERELVDIIRSSGGTLERLLSDILDSARIESGELILESAPFDLPAMLGEIVELWSARAEAKGVRIDLVCGDGLADRVMGDVVRLRQVLNNLVSNALKFTDGGTVTLEALRAQSDRVYFCVTDTGVGFDDEVRQRIFARFQQADESITRRYGGSGLGLNISQELINMMGGQMDCASIPGHGAKFWFELKLPRVQTEPSVAEKRDLMADHSVETSTGLGLRVLLADDHAANRKVVEVLLAPLDVEIVSVVDGQQALDAFVEDHFDLVLMDMQMPVMDGVSATRRLREIEKRDGRIHTPIVMLTANAMAEHIEASLAAGADAHLTKPLTVKSLMNAINSVLDVAA